MNDTQPAGIRVAVASVDGRQAFMPGDTLEAEYRLESLTAVAVRWIEVSVLWHTLGKGDEDLAVHYFERIADDRQLMTDLRRTRFFSTTLPNSPLSYDGRIVKICWCARVRVALVDGKELVAEWPFQLGNVPPAKEPPPVARRGARARAAEREAAAEATEATEATGATDATGATETTGAKETTGATKPTTREPSAAEDAE